MTPASLNNYLLTAGIIGIPICLYGWHRWHHNLWLLGLGIFIYFALSSVREISRK